MHKTDQPEHDQYHPRRVLVSAEFFAPAYRGGGPIQTLAALIESAPREVEIAVVCSNHDLGEAAPLVEQPNEWRQWGPAKVRYVQGGLRSLIASYRATAEVDVVYLNSLFNPRYSILPLVLHRLGLWRGATILLAPRGELGPGALALKAPKKKAFLSVYKLLRFSSTMIWHASNDEEASQIASIFGAKSCIIVRENEASLPRAARRRSAREPGEARLLFASRLVPKKGLLTLIQALKDVKSSVTLAIVGAFEDPDYEARCYSAISELGSRSTIRLLGALPREEVLREMYAADLMVFPTAGENFGHVIIEALSESCPVMCSQHTPWTDRLSAGGGTIVTSESPSDWARAITDFLTLGPDAWHAVSARAGEAFTTWRHENKGPHVFDLLLTVRDHLVGPLTQPSISRVSPTS